eukprot:g1474.t1
MVVTHTKEAYEALVNEVKALKEENKRLRNVRTTSEVELQPKTRDRKASRNSLAEIYRETTTLRKHTMLLGQEVETDDRLERRVKWGQRGLGTSAFFTLICWVAGQNLATIVLAALTFVFAVILYYKNVSLVLAKRLLRETNVVIIILLSLCVAAIDIARPAHTLSAINGLIYVLGVSAFVFIGALKVKSRVFVIVVGILFVLITVNNIYDRTFEDTDQGVVLLKYNIQGNKYTFMKRSTQRAIFIQVLLFSMNGVYTLFKDRKQELMIFATGNIYRETGTASKEVKDKQYSMKLKPENVV